MIITKTTQPMIKFGRVTESRTTWRFLGIPVLTKKVLHPMPEDVQKVIECSGGFEWSANP